MTVMEFPRDVFEMSDGCIAIIGSGRGKGGKKWAGKPILHKRPGLLWQGEYWQASRLSFNLNNSPISRKPENKCEGHVLHTCDQEWCIEPSHLYLGTHADNMRDMFERHPTIHQKLSAAAKGKKASPATRLKLSLASKGNKRSLGYKASPEARAKRSEFQTGRKASPEARAKMSVSQQARRAQERR